MLFCRRANLGFTLIELLVTTTLGLLLMGGAVASYSAFATRQDRIESARDLQAVLRSAQSRSRSGNKPETDCSQFGGYRVWGVQSTQNYFVSVRCDGDDVETEEYQLNAGQYFLESFDLTFPVLPGAVNGAPSTIQIGNLDDPGSRYEFSISQQGVIAEGELISE